MATIDDLTGRTWALVAIDAEAAAADVATGLQFGADGRITGSGGVNRVMGGFALDGEEITFSGVASTRMAGPPAAMAQEQALLGVLDGTQPISVDGDMLTIGPATFRGDPVEDATVTVSGSVLYRERIALPPGAVVTVAVRDVSRADAPSVTLGEQRIEPDHQVPIPFRIDIPVESFSGVVVASVSARIEVAGELAWISDTHHPVATDGPTTIDVVVVSARSG